MRQIFILQDYLAYIKMSHKMHLLVEGEDDRWFFSKIAKNAFDGECPFDIESAEQLRECKSVSNREKVEECCDECIRISAGDNIVGFIDREWRDFQILPSFGDSIGQHNIIANKYWSRGHSIENYLFDKTILESSLDQLSVGYWIDEAVELFISRFESALRLTCILCLLYKESHVENLIPSQSYMHSCLDAKFFTVGQDIEFSFPSLLQVYRARGMSSESMQKISHLYTAIESNVQQAELETCKWLCHGHMGMRILSLVFERICSDIIQRERATGEDIRGFNEAAICIKFRTFANKWIMEILEGRAEYPVELFRRLGIVQSRLGSPNKREVCS